MVVGGKGRGRGIQNEGARGKGVIGGRGKGIQNEGGKGRGVTGGRGRGVPTASRGTGGVNNGSRGSGRGRAIGPNSGANIGANNGLVVKGRGPNQGILIGREKAVNTQMVLRRGRGHHFVVMECEKSKRSAYIVVQHATQFSKNSSVLVPSFTSLQTKVAFSGSEQFAVMEKKSTHLRSPPSSSLPLLETRSLSTQVELNEIGPPTLGSSQAETEPEATELETESSNPVTGQVEYTLKDGLDVIKSSIEKVRDNVAYWTTTPKREEKFEDAARQLGVF
ncbi:hypothetical protein RHSIM_Rhsim05G0163900 [Rhododendron simsii]|uniref:Uncharacterized protein n=1 Tax=Rhododendron simsii TaxID=118357 RepID=A0A834H2K2_RHOSS|nr:hypothetical protein RHSIM_Rhsim05G0163900 [Rhododendron simsii]